MIRSAIVLGLVLLFAGTTQKASAQDEEVSLQSFYDELAPYGTWIQDPQYGYVWRPDVDQEEFRPYYTNGRWVMTEYGNTWVSNYDWGWAPFHYGRWVYNRYNQWIWLPDTVWGPAWVSWRSGGGYYGWAPLGPSISIGINIGRGGYRIPDMCWNFIPYSNIYYSNYPRYSYSRNRVYIQNTVIINNTYVRNNRTYYTGPRVDDIRRATNQNVNIYRINRSHNPGVARIESNRVNIYQPRPGRDNNGTPAPRSVVKGSINRGTVSRDNNAPVNRGNVYQGNRGDGRSEGRPDYGNVNRAPRSNNNNANTENRGREVQNATPGQRPSIFDRNRNQANEQAQRVERNTPAQPQAQPQQRVEQRAEQPRAERSREVYMQQRERQQAERQQAERQSAPQQAPQQRMERPESRPSSPRVERSQPQQRGNSGGENRGGGRASGGRPGRG